MLTQPRPRPVSLAAKLKPKMALEVTVTGGSDERIRWGGWGEAVQLEFRYNPPSDGC